MNVLSLFDGISCGREALKRLNKQIDNYYAYEIEPNAISIATYNHKDIQELGNVLTANFIQYEGIDLLLGGSPCKNFSTVGNTVGLDDLVTYEKYMQTKKNGDISIYGESCLFWEYVRALKEAKPKYFLLENVSMKKKWRDLISKELGVEPIKLNSDLVSAQNRERLYWTNIPNIGTLKDKGITLDKVLTKDTYDYIKKLTPFAKKGLNKLKANIGYIPHYFNTYNARVLTEKSPCLTTAMGTTASSSILIYENEKYYLANALAWERLQTLPDNYTDVPGVSRSCAKKAIGNAWTVDIIVHILSNLP